MSLLLEQIHRAYQLIRPYARITPLEYSPLISNITGCKVYLKCEHLQQTGSFKFRGALNKLRQLPPYIPREKGIITASTGNHGLAMSMAGKLLNTAITVYAPITASSFKLEAIKAFNGQIVLVKGNALAAEHAAKEQALRQNVPFVSPYNDYDIIAGQGTIGLELFEQLPHLDAVFVSVGGGGLISGIATAIKYKQPQVRIIGCWPTHAATMHYCMQSGQIIEIAEEETISDGTAGGVEQGSITFPLCQQLIDHNVLVNEYEIKEAMRLIAETERWMVEGAAGVAMAAMLRSAPSFQNKSVAVVICGRNISLSQYLQSIHGTNQPTVTANIKK